MNAPHVTKTPTGAPRMRRGLTEELRFDRETTKGLVSFQVREAHTFIMMEHAQACPACHVMRHFWVNRGGVTVCAECDGGVDPKAQRR